MEQVIRNLPLNTVAVRAAWFMENFEGSTLLALDSGIFSSFLNPPDLMIPMVSVKDIGRVCAELLLEKWQGHRLVELRGPRNYGAKDVATILHNASGIPVLVQSIPENEYHQTYLSFGFTTGAAAMTEMNHGFNSGHIRFEESEEIIRIQGDTTLEEVLQNQFKNENQRK